VQAADDEGIDDSAIVATVRFGRPVSKDIDQYGTRQVGINFERTLSDWR
jgi:hypothetical protein